MKGTLDRMREVKRIIEDEGLTIDKVVPGPHYKFYVTNEHGLKTMVVTGSSNSDTNANKAVRSRIKRFAREKPGATA